MVRIDDRSVPTCANTEDHVRMSPLVARGAADVVDMAQTLLATECLLAAQAMDLRGIDPAPLLVPLYRAIRGRSLSWSRTAFWVTIWRRSDRW